MIFLNIFNVITLMQLQPSFVTSDKFPFCLVDDGLNPSVALVHAKLCSGHTRRLQCIWF